MKKICFIMIGSSPHYIRFATYLGRYYDVRMLFYTPWKGHKRLPWYASDWNAHCRRVPCVWAHGKLITISHLIELFRFKPDLIVLGGFSSFGNYLAYLWGRVHRCKLVVQTERSRKSGGTLRGYTFWRRLINFNYRRLDQVWVTSEDAVTQFRDTFHYDQKAVYCPYPADFERYLTHPLRQRKDAYTLIFPNRMTDIYNPLMAVQIFAEVLQQYPKTKLRMNAAGEMRAEVAALIKQLGVDASVEFLDNIPSWSSLSEIYASSDIMFLPAKFSNGNYTVMEAMASGMGIVISEKILGEIPGVLRNNSSGFVLQPTIEAFVEKICWFIDNPEKMADFALGNRRCMAVCSLDQVSIFYRQRIETLFGYPEQPGGRHKDKLRCC